VSVCKLRLKRIHQIGPRSWQSYFCHSVRNAGLGLAFLYMTVLGFDNITYGYCMSQCVNETVLGALVPILRIFISA
jgi:iron-regulated transporter 1